MKDNLRTVLFCLPHPIRVFGLAVALAFVIALSGCGNSEIPDVHEYDAADGLSLVWEAWDRINHIYVGSEQLDTETAVSGAMLMVLDLLDVPPYPFLTDVGRMRGQAPRNVPVELVDLWRTVFQYRSLNQGFEPSTIARAAISGLVGGLGDSSAVFLDATQYPLARESLEGGIEGSYLGIGSRVVSRDGQIVLFPFAGSPAERAGVLSGDVLIGVGRDSVIGQNVGEVVKNIEGPKGTKVRLQIIRIGESDPVTLEVFRGDIELQSVASQLVPGGIGYLRISRFRDNTGEQVFIALEALNRFDLLALVLDIRGNPGGSTEAAKITLAQFLPEGSVYGYKEDRDGNRTQLTINVNEKFPDLNELLIAVLIDDQTARESEIVAAALQDTGRATLFGINTYGDASDYEFVELSDGSAMYLPVSRRYTPLGSLIESTGIAPDVVVQSFPETGGLGGESQFNRAYEFLNGQLPPFR